MSYYNRNHFPKLQSYC